MLFKRGHLLSKDDAQAVESAGVTEVEVRSPLTCKTLHGICSICYGLDLGRNKLVQMGEAIGIVAAQAIGEPGTQLTMRTFHQGGVAGVDITMGLPRVEEIFERRMPKNPAIIATVSGEVIEIREDGKDKIVKILADPASVKKGKSNEIEFILPYRRTPLVKAGDKINKGDLLSDGSVDLSELFKYAGKEAAEEYIIKEINNVYELQGASISRKHIEVIIRQMFSRRKITHSGDSNLSNGDIVENLVLERENERIRADGGEEAKANPLILGISEVSLSTKSWLSAASFQNTTRVLINTAVRGGIDDLRGLKENVIIGRSIPVGTNYEGRAILEEDGEEKLED